MGVTGRGYCDFFVYTHHGFHLERILFDREHWINILENLKKFWYDHLAPELLLQKLSKSISQHDDEPSQTPKNISTPETTLFTKTKVVNTFQTLSINDKRKEQDQISQQMSKRFVYSCNICNRQLKDNPKRYADHSIACDICNKWFHFQCVNIKKGNEPRENDEWVCMACQDS